MAIVGSDPNMQQDDPNQKDKDPGATAQGGGVNVSGASASGAGASPSANAGGASATPAGTSSGRFQNLQGYLKANAGYNQGQGLAGQVGTSLSGQEQNQEQNIGQEQQRVQSQATAAGQPYQSDTLNQYAQQAYADPTKVNQAQWAQYYGGQYAAPAAYDASGQLQQGQQNFQAQTGLVGTEPGRMQLLQQLYNTPGYSVGQQNLDNLLLQSQPGQLSQLQSQAGQLGSQLGTQYASGQSAAQAALDQLKAAATTGSQTLQSGLNTDIGQEQSALQSKIAPLQQQRQADYDKALGQLQHGDYTPDVLSELGLTHGMQIYNVNPADYLNKDTVGTVGVGNVATAADQAKFNALAQMAGQPVQSALGQFANVSSPMASAVQFRNPEFQNAIAAAGRDYGTKFKDFQGQMAPILADLATQRALPINPKSGQVLQPGQDNPYNGNITRDKAEIADLNAKIAALQQLYGTNRTL